jgi:hypothetical protein
MHSALPRRGLRRYDDGRKRSGSLEGFEGALGPPDIDALHGTWNTVGAVYCYEETAAGIAPRYDVLRFNRSTGALDGTFDCFPGF